MTPSSAMPPACRALATPVAHDGGAALYALRFELTSAGPSGATLPYSAPFMLFTLTATARDGSAVPVQEPAWHAPARAASLTLEPGRPAMLSTPVMLRIGPGARADASRFERAIPAAREDVDVRAHLQLPPFDLDCIVDFRESSP